MKLPLGRQGENLFYAQQHHYDQGIKFGRYVYHSNKRQTKKVCEVPEFLKWRKEDQKFKADPQLYSNCKNSLIYMRSGLLPLQKEQTKKKNVELPLFKWCSIKAKVLIHFVSFEHHKL